MASVQQPTVQQVVTRLLTVAVAAFLTVGYGDVPEPLALACAQEEAPAEAAAPLAAAQDPEDRALVDYLSRRFLIAGESTLTMVQTARRAAREVGLDPLLVLAVISVESRFNPIAESGVGAKGLMQIIPRYHRDKLLEHGGDDAVLDPQSNIHVGARILQEYIYRTGTMEAGLQLYNGAFRDNTAQYAQKVLAERERLEQVIRPRRTVTALAVREGG